MKDKQVVSAGPKTSSAETSRRLWYRVITPGGDAKTETVKDIADVRKRDIAVSVGSGSKHSDIRKRIAQAIGDVSTERKIQLPRKTDTVARADISHKDITKIGDTRDSKLRVSDNSPRSSGGKDTLAKNLSASVEHRDRVAPGRPNDSVYKNSARRQDSRDSGPSARHTPSTQVVIKGDNNIYIAGDVKGSYHRPYIPRSHIKSAIYLHNSSTWYDCGGFYVWRWSPYSYGRIVCLPAGHHWGMSYFYPRYHRRYVFVSIGGYWPADYRYIRYYWYGCHPYYWYGPYAIDRPVEYNTYNTYNYYDSAGSGSGNSSPSAGYIDFSDVREKLAKQQQQAQAENTDNLKDTPEQASIVDESFQLGVEAFGKENYTAATEQFRQAVIFAPDDIILPFAYCQSLFACGDYSHAASVLRQALEGTDPNSQTVYYPRGLYNDQKILAEQINKLAGAVKSEPYNADYKLLLGYQLLGTDELERTELALRGSAESQANIAASEILLGLLEKVRAEKAEESTK